MPEGTWPVIGRPSCGPASSGWGWPYLASPASHLDPDLGGVRSRRPRRLPAAVIAGQEQVVDLDGQHRQLGGPGRAHRAAPRGRRGGTSPPPAPRRARPGRSAVGWSNRHRDACRAISGWSSSALDPGGRQHPAVVGATGRRSVLVDRAALVDEHRAVAALVVAEEDVAAWQARRREQQLGGDVRQRVGLVGPDVDELRRRAARGAAAARHVRAALPRQRRLHHAQPRREGAGVQLGLVVGSGSGISSPSDITPTVPSRRRGASAGWGAHQQGGLGEGEEAADGQRVGHEVPLGPVAADVGQHVELVRRSRRPPP